MKRVGVNSWLDETIVLLILVELIARDTPTS